MPAPAAKPGRRAPRAYGRAELAVLSATERLLEDHPLNQLSVADIIRVAGISRTSFYVYFASKTAVICACLRRVMDEIRIAGDPFLAPSGTEPETAIRLSLERWIASGTAHGALVRAVSEEWPHDEELRQIWFEMLNGVAEAVAQVIRVARARGNAPPGADADALAACLVWTYERVLHVALVGEAQGLPTPRAMVEPLAQMVTAACSPANWTGPDGASDQGDQGGTTRRP